MNRVWVWYGAGMVVLMVLILLLSTLFPYAIVVSLLPYFFLSEVLGIPYLASGLDAFNLPNTLGWIVNYSIWFILGSAIGISRKAR